MRGEFITLLPTQDPHLLSGQNLCMGAGRVDSLMNWGLWVKGLLISTFGAVLLHNFHWPSTTFRQSKGGFVWGGELTALHEAPVEGLQVVVRERSKYSPSSGSLCEGPLTSSLNNRWSCFAPTHLVIPYCHTPPSSSPRLLVSKVEVKNAILPSSLMEWLRMNHFYIFLCLGKHQLL